MNCVLSPLKFAFVTSTILLLSSCKKEPIVVAPSYTIPSTYTFTDNNGNSTIDYLGQSNRLDQLREMVAYLKTGTSALVNAQQLNDMFSNVGDNGNGHFSFTAAGKQLKNKCFSVDVTLFEDYFDSIALASTFHMQTAANGQAGVLSSGTSKYLFSKNGIEYKEIIEKGLMGAVFMHQALNVYLGDSEMNVDNSTAVDAANGKYYTLMEHHWDEAFGYLGVPINFPTALGVDFWAKYTNAQNPILGSNALMMDNFLKGRAAITNKVLKDRDAAILIIQNTWEDICAYQAMTYLSNAISYYGNDNAKYLHALSEAYAFVWNLRYAPELTRNITQSEVTSLVNRFGTNFWNLTLVDLNSIKNEIDQKY